MMDAEGFLASAVSHRSEQQLFEISGCCREILPLQRDDGGIGFNGRIDFGMSYLIQAEQQSRAGNDGDPDAGFGEEHER